ncbi:MAG TPA: amidohydrolase, partial [Bacillales bacterium]
GYSMANIDMFKGTIHGKGGHGAYPQQCQDPIWMLGPAMQALYGIISRKVSPLESGVVTIGQINGGTSTNVIPSKVEVEGTLRSYSPEVREFLVEEVEKAFSVVKPLGGDVDVDITHGEPALQNDPQVNEWLKNTIQDIYPSFQTYEGPFGLGGEDFSWVTKNMPGAMFFLGCKMSDGKQRDLHTPEFDIDESCLPYGAAILAETAMRYLSGRYELGDKSGEEATSDA